MHRNSGYHSCPCRDCMEIAIGCDDEGNPDLCSECEDAGCNPDGEHPCEVEYQCHPDDAHPATGEIPMHDPVHEFYAACPACKEDKP